MNTGQGSDRLVPQVIFNYATFLLGFPLPSWVLGGDAGLRHARLHRRVQHGAFASVNSSGGNQKIKTVWCLRLTLPAARHGWSPSTPGSADGLSSRLKPAQLDASSIQPRRRPTARPPASSSRAPPPRPPPGGDASAPGEHEVPRDAPGHPALLITNIALSPSWSDHLRLSLRYPLILYVLEKMNITTLGTTTIGLDVTELVWRGYPGNNNQDQVDFTQTTYVF